MSRLTSKYQTTIPGPVRKALGLNKGDSLVFETSADGVVTLRKAMPLDIEWTRTLESTLSEWNTEEDREAYRGL